MISGMPHGKNGRNHTDSNTLYKWPANFLGSRAISLYWLFDVMQRAKTTNSDKIANIWEGDKYQFLTGLLHTRPQDHPMLTDIYLSEYRQRHALRKGMGPLSPHLATYKEEP